MLSHTIYCICNSIQVSLLHPTVFFLRFLRTRRSVFYLLRTLHDLRIFAIRIKFLPRQFQQFLPVTRVSLGEAFRCISLFHFNVRHSTILAILVIPTIPTKFQGSPFLRFFTLQNLNLDFSSSSGTDGAVVLCRLDAIPGTLVQAENV